jgi:hypothetical protein
VFFGDMDNARKGLERAMATEPNHAYALGALAGYCAFQGQMAANRRTPSISRARQRVLASFRVSSDPSLPTPANPRYLSSTLRDVAPAVDACRWAPHQAARFHRKNYATDAAYLTWELDRHQRLKAHVRSVSYRKTLKGLIVDALLEAELS